MEKMKEMKCRFCEYIWISRKLNPVSCPACKRRFDYQERVKLIKIKTTAENGEKVFNDTVSCISNEKEPEYKCEGCEER